SPSPTPPARVAAHPGSRPARTTRPPAHPRSVTPPRPPAYPFFRQPRLRMRTASLQSPAPRRAMKKIRMDVEALQVESFQAGAAEQMPRGPVHANRLEQLRDDIPHDESQLVCATNGFNYCAAPSYGCVVVTEGCYYVITSLC